MALDGSRSSAVATTDQRPQRRAFRSTARDFHDWSAPSRHGRAYRFLDRACWCVDQVGLVLLKVIVDRLVSAEEPLLIGIDDTLFRRSGPKVHATA